MKKKQIGCIAALAIGALLVIVPLATSWNTENQKTGVAGGIGIIIAAIYAWVRDIPPEVRGGGGAADTAVIVDWSKLEVYDWIVLIGCVAGGFLIGALL